MLFRSEFGLQLRRVPRAEREQKRDALLELVGLPGFAGREAVQLSGGQQQRVAIARALAYEPKVLLLDEPFGALDVKIRTQLRRNLRAIHDRLRITTVLVTHDQEEAFELADRVGVMDRGRLVEVGRAEELYARPRSLFAATFLGSGTVLMGQVHDGEARFEGLDFGLAPQVPHEEGSHAHLLVRPEDLAVSAAPAPDRPGLGSGAVVEQTFAGAIRRVRIQLSSRTAVHPASTPGPGPDGLRVEAVLPSHHSLPDGEVWVHMQRWHFLDPPPGSVLAADDGRGSARVLGIARDIGRALHARVTILGVASDARLSERLGRRIERRQRAAQMSEAELRLRFGNPANQILNEQAELLSRLIVFAPRASRFDWLERLRLQAGYRGRIGGTIARVLENSRVPVLLVAGNSESFHRALVAAVPGTGTTGLLRAAGQIARPLGMTLSVVETRAEGEGTSESGAVPRGDLAVAAGMAIESRLKIEGRSPDEIATQLLEMPSDLLVLPIVKRGHYEVHQIGPLVSYVLARTDRPVLVVPVAPDR